MARPAFSALTGAVLAALLVGCGHPSYYAEAESRFSTGGFFPTQGHFAVYYPSEIALDFPGYVVGIEMSHRADILRDGDLQVVVPTDAGSTITHIAEKLRDGRGQTGQPNREDRIPFISHVLRYPGGANEGETCALYNVYQASRPDLTPFCDDNPRPRIDDWADYHSGFADSWLAIDTLKTALEHDVSSGRYTHLVVVTLGWRTPQEEAIRSFRSIVHSTRKAGGKDFRPLFVGVTWVGPWAGRWFDPIVETFSYVEIAHLADTIGLTWLGALSDEVLLPLSSRLPLVVISHSFGSRAASTAACIGSVIRRDASSVRPTRSGAVERLIAFQAAFSLERFHEEPPNIMYEDIHFPDRCDRARSIVLTTTRHDSAVRLILWADHAGNHRYHEPFCRENSDTFVSCASVDATGAIEGPYDATRRVLYLDASELIRYKAPGSDGGAHSDIFRAGAGSLIWNLISSRP